MATKTKKKPKKAPAKKAPAKAAAKQAKAVKKPKTEAAVAAAAVSAAPTGLCAAVAKATKTDVKDGETLADYAVRACQVISEMTEDAYGALDPKIQDWFDAAVELINAEKQADITLAGFPKAAKAAPAGNGAAAEEAEAPAPRKRVAVKDKEKKTTKAKGNGKQGTLPGVAKGGKARVDSVAYRMRQQVVNNIDISFDDACKGAKLKAERGSNAWNAYFNAVQTMRIARAEGVAK